MHRFKDSSVARVFAAYPDQVRAKLMILRELIFATAAAIPEVGPLKETLKWRQPSYLTSSSGSGSTIRIDAVVARGADYALYFHCQTSLVSIFKRRFGPLFRYEGNRALLFSVSDPLPRAEVAECIALALTYHSARKSGRVPIGSLIR